MVEKKKREGKGQERQRKVKRYLMGNRNKGMKKGKKREGGREVKQVADKEKQEEKPWEERGVKGRL